MAVHAADKPGATEPRPADVSDSSPSPRSFRWNAANALVPKSSDKHMRLVEHLQASGYLSSENCVLAMQMVDRRDFVLPEIPHNVIYKVRPQF
jgi:hypothetical protein